jgi:hypothetical protein
VHRLIPIAAVAAAAMVGGHQLANVETRLLTNIATQLGPIANQPHPAPVIPMVSHP